MFLVLVHTQANTDVEQRVEVLYDRAAKWTWLKQHLVAMEAGTSKQIHPLDEHHSTAQHGWFPVLGGGGVGVQQLLFCIAHCIALLAGNVLVFVNKKADAEDLHASMTTAGFNGEHTPLSVCVCVCVYACVCVCACVSLFLPLLPSPFSCSSSSEPSFALCKLASLGNFEM